MTWAVAVTAMLGLATVAVTWLTARRARSGKIDDTPAETLWAELRAELVAVRAELVAVRAENSDLRKVIVTLTAQITSCETEVKRHRRSLDRAERNR